MAPWLRQSLKYSSQADIQHLAWRSFRPELDLAHRQQQAAEDEEQAEQRPRGSRKRKAAKRPSRQARPQAEDAMGGG